MEEQATPLNELIILNLYLGSVTYLLGIAFVLLVMKKNNNFNWFKLSIIVILLVSLGCVASMLIWSVWISKIDLMLGPIHLPTLIAIPILAIFLLKIFGYKIIGRNPLPNNT